MAAVHREGLGYPGPDTGPQAWSRALHLPRVYHILHRHSERAPWEEKDISAYAPARRISRHLGTCREPSLPLKCLQEARPKCANAKERAKKM